MRLQPPRATDPAHRTKLCQALPEDPTVARYLASRSRGLFQLPVHGRRLMSACSTAGLKPRFKPCHVANGGGEFSNAAKPGPDPRAADGTIGGGCEHWEDPPFGKRAGTGPLIEPAGQIQSSNPTREPPFIARHEAGNGGFAASARRLGKARPAGLQAAQAIGRRSPRQGEIRGLWGDAQQRGPKVSL